MKILAISTSALPSPSNGYGGLENVLYDTCEGMAILGHEVTLITTNDSSKLGIHEAIGADGKSTGGVLDVKTAGPGGWGIQFERDMYFNYKEFMENQFGEGQGLILSMNWFGYPYLSLGGWRNVQLPNGQIMDIPAHPKMKMIHVIHGTTGLGGQKIPSTVKFPRLVGVSRPQAAFLGSQFGFPVRHVHNGIKIPPKPETWPPHEDFYL